MSALRRALDSLPPDVFAVVMATGIVAVAGDDHGYRLIADVLGALAAAAFAVLVVAAAARFSRNSFAALADLRDPDAALRSFTFVAACGVLAARWHDQTAVVAPLAAASLAAWLVFVPLAAVDVRSRTEVELRDYAHGAWLLAAVGTETLAVSASDLAVLTKAGVLVACAVVAWLLGIVFYAATAWLILWRFVAERLRPEAVTPDSWILMGALAIATLGGARIVGATRALPAQSWAADLARPGTLVLWIVASLWFPVLLYAELWRLDQRPGSAHYQGVWWSMVFPLGMYATATWGVAIQLHMPELRTVSLVVFWVAATVWAVVALGLIHSGLAHLAGRRRRLRRPPSRAAAPR